MQVHVDLHKHAVCMQIVDHSFVLSSCMALLHFHMCKRFACCSWFDVRVGTLTSMLGTHIVYVNLVTMGSASWGL